MKFITYKTPMAFYDVMKDMLHHNEVTNILTIGLLRSAEAQDDFSKCFYAVGYVEETIEIGLMIQGLHLILMTESDQNLKLAAEFMSKQDITYPGVIGPRPYVDQFVEYLNDFGKKSIELDMSQRIYKLTHVNETAKVAGNMRYAGPEDLETIIKWNGEFAIMDGVEPDYERMRKRRGKDIEKKRLFVWEVDGEVVTMTSLSKSSGSGVIVSLVFTPEDQRKKGYATALVSEVSKYALEQYDYCALYTDLSNPISNSIYMKIGYKEIVDSAMYLVK